MPEGRIRIFVCALDWGLGHITRTLPLLHILTQSGFEVILGGNETAKRIWTSHYPTLPFVHMYNHKIRYGSSKNLFRMMWWPAISIFRGIREDKILIKKIQREYNIHLIISDNRYGAVSKKAPSVFIGHQLSPILPSSFFILNKLLFNILNKLTRSYSAIWIPDNTSLQTIIYTLKSPYTPQLKAISIGLMSQFQFTNVQHHFSRPIVALLSGPEPHRSQFEKLISAILNTISIPSIIIRGLNPNAELPENNNSNIKILNFATGSQLHSILTGAHLIIARSGYSTLMDVIYLQKKSLLIPTPGQTEQEYLAKMNAGRYGIHTCNQYQLCKETVLEAFDKPYCAQPAEFVSCQTISREVERITKSI